MECGRVEIWLRLSCCKCCSCMTRCQQHKQAFPLSCSIYAGNLSKVPVCASSAPMCASSADHIAVVRWHSAETLKYKERSVSRSNCEAEAAADIRLGPH